MLGQCCSNDRLGGNIRVFDGVLSAILAAANVSYSRVATARIDTVSSSAGGMRPAVCQFNAHWLGGIHPVLHP